MRKAFSLIEVVLSVSILIMVGIGMAVLNSTALKLMSTNEVTATAFGLNDEALSYITLQRYNQANFDTYLGGIDGSCTLTNGCVFYIACPITDMTQGCSVTGSGLKPAGTQLGRAKITYNRKMYIKKINADDYTVQVTTTWGSRSTQQVSITKFLN